MNGLQIDINTGDLLVERSAAVVADASGFIAELVLRSCRGALGRSTVHAVATADTSVYKSLCIEVVPPRLRLASAGALRLDGKGNIRLT